MNLGLRLSARGIISLLERGLSVHLIGMDKMMQQAISSLTPVAADVVLEEAQPLRIARTAMPDTRADFNETFQHIRLEYDRFYKQQVPIFNNSAVADLLTSEPLDGEFLQPELKSLPSATGGAQGDAQEFMPQNQVVQSDTPVQREEIDLNLTNNVAVKVVLAEEWEMHRISRTVLPEQRPDFNETFQHIRQESDRFYQQQVPIFDNTLTTEDLATEHAPTEQDLSPEQVCPQVTVKELNITGGVQRLVDLFLTAEAAKTKARTDLAASVAQLKKAQIKRASGNVLPYCQQELLQFNQYPFNQKQALPLNSTTTARSPVDIRSVSP